MATNITFHPGHIVPLKKSTSLINQSHSPGSVTAAERSEFLEQKGVTIWLTGLSASGKV